MKIETTPNQINGRKSLPCFLHKENKEKTSLRYARNTTQAYKSGGYIENDHFPINNSNTQPI
jgi:hypothetical protein